jgi:hypothetical protein
MVLITPELVRISKRDYWIIIKGNIQTALPIKEDQ